MPDDFEYFSGKRPNQIYISKAFDELGELARFLPDGSRKMRIISKVFDSTESHEFAEIKGEVVLRITDGERQEIKAVFYEDTREIKSFTIQRYTRDTGKPHQKTHFTFQGEEIDKLYNLIRCIKHLRLSSEGKETLDDRILDDLLISADEKRRYLLENPDLVIEVARNNITKSDIIALAYRKKQLELFGNLLDDENFFEETRIQWEKRGVEAVWQQFFENNHWIFGYGLNYIFSSNLDDKKLEQVTTGYSVQGSGKRVDALMKTRGLISSLCFVEIKTHEAPLLSQIQNPYRSECWQISGELADSIAQIQKTVQKALEHIKNRLEIQNETGDPTGEIAFLYQPRACVVIGSLGEFQTEHGINEQKFSSFELFRRNMVNPEIITFDELFERSKFIVRHSEEEESLVEKDDDAGVVLNK